MDYNILRNKNIVNRNGEQYLDLLYKSFDLDLKQTGTLIIVNKYYVARPDLISLAMYGDDDYGDIICKDIPAKYLKVKDVSGHWINNLFYRMLRDADCPKTPKLVQYLYRAGVALNLAWFKTGKVKIDVNKLYDEVWNEIV